MQILTPASGQIQANEEALPEAFAAFLRLDVANGDTSPDTIRGYKAQVKAWVRWCNERGINPARATTANVKAYRQALVEEGCRPSTIAHKLTVLGRFYAAALDGGLRRDSPAAGIRPPRDKKAVDDLSYLSEVELAILFRTIPKSGTEKHLRDRAMITMMELQGLRTVEIWRANVEDIERRGEVTVLLVRGKNRDRLVTLRDDGAEVLRSYLAVRGRVTADEWGTPMFTAVGNRAGGRRISRRGIRQVVDFYLKAADLKRPGVLNHALRHTAATLAYKYTQNLRAVQDFLGHADPKTTARYAYIVKHLQNNLAAAVPVTL